MLPSKTRPYTSGPFYRRDVLMASERMVGFLHAPLRLVVFLSLTMSVLPYLFQIWVFHVCPRPRNNLNLLKRRTPATRRNRRSPRDAHRGPPMSVVDEVHDEMDQVSGFVRHAYTACWPRFALRWDLAGEHGVSYSKACEAC